MALSWKTRRRLSLLLLLIWLPLYIVAAGGAMTALGRPPLWLELAIYLALGVLWALPFRFVFRGVGKAKPEDE